VISAGGIRGLPAISAVCVSAACAAAAIIAIIEAPIITRTQLLLE
jgi:hypothetical protein